jgi:hydroxyethylthiazole kinase
VCGAGATELRDRKVFELLDQVKINIIKGNASEIARVSGANIRTKGVDATEVGTDLARRWRKSLPFAARPRW